MGDKTQLLTLVLVARYRRPWTILAGVSVATLLNHGMASWAGGWAAAQLSPQTLKWGLIALFTGFGLWILIPDKEDDCGVRDQRGVFWTTVVVFFLAEMGDKTQLATVALGARFHSVWLVTLGSTLGMLAANALAASMGPRLLKRVPMKAVRITACFLFIAFAVLIYFQ